MPGPTVNQKTRERLYLEALAHPKFQGMEESEVRAFINAKLDTFLSKQPYWYGQIDDTKHHAAQRQYKARRQREHLVVSSKNKLHQQEHEPELEDNGPSDLRTVCESEPGEEIQTSVQVEEELVPA